MLQAEQKSKEHIDMKKIQNYIFGLLSVLITFGAINVQAAELNNKEAMKGIKEMKVIYDVRKSDPNVMLAYLKGIEGNRKNIILEGAKPKQRVIFISSAVQFITTEPSDEVLMNHGEVLTKIAEVVKHLQSIGVEMEVCNAATAFFKIDNSTLLPGLKPVRSGFLSVMGWQQQGYQLVPVY